MLDIQFNLESAMGCLGMVVGAVGTVNRVLVYIPSRVRKQRGQPTYSATVRPFDEGVLEPIEDRLHDVGRCVAQDARASFDVDWGTDANPVTILAASANSGSFL